MQLLSLLVGILGFQACAAFDTAHFFRPPFMERGPWFAKDWLTALYVNGAYGATNTSKNCGGKNVCLLDLYGTHKVQQSALGVANPEPILQQLALVPTNDGFGSVSLRAKAYITEATIELYQNFKQGLFLHAHLPIRRIKVTTPLLHDLSPQEGNGPLANNPLWQTFLRNYPSILAYYHLSVAPLRELGVGDLGIAVGWTTNYEEFEHLDFLDATIQCGVTAPTSKQSRANHIITIPLGYNGHTGFFGKFDASIGILDWLTCATYFSAMGFNKHTSLERVKTNSAQQGLILLDRQPVNVSLGTILACGLLFRADHFLRGCSLDIEYQFQHQGKSRWLLCESQQAYLFADQRLASWDMHTINIEFSYDFSHIDKPSLPIIGFIYNIPVAGKRIFMDPMGGGSFAIMASWNW